MFPSCSPCYPPCWVFSALLTSNVNVELLQTFGAEFVPQGLSLILTVSHLSFFLTICHSGGKNSLFYFSKTDFIQIINNNPLTQHALML